MDELFLAILSTLLIAALIPLYLWKLHHHSRPSSSSPEEEPHQLCNFQPKTLISPKKFSISTSSDSHIHDDIAFSILSKLPIKSLTRFACVQKSWSLLLQDAHFMNMFRTIFISKLDEDNNSMCLILNKQSPEFPFHQSLCMLSSERFEDRVTFDLPPFLQHGNATHMLWRPFENLGYASVNGVLCLYRGFANNSKTVLWNPATGEFKVIPPSFLYYNIKFNYCPAAFGYDSVRNDYKVIRYIDPIPHVDKIDMNDRSRMEKVLIVRYMYDHFWEIYSLKSNSWRKINGVYMDISNRSMSEVNLNGFSHWLNEDDMLSFDFNKEVFFTTNLPSISGVGLKSALVVLNGSISLISNYNETNYLHIWILGELGVKESWTKLFVVGPLTCSINRPISIANKSRIFFEKKGYGIAWFDLSTQRIEEIEVKEESIYSEVVIYKENLLPFGG